MPARFRSYTVPATLVVLAVTVVFAVAGATADRRAVASQVGVRGDTVTADTNTASFVHRTGRTSPDEVRILSRHDRKWPRQSAVVSPSVDELCRA